MQGTDLGLFHLLKRHPGSFTYLLSRQMISGTQDRNHIIGLLSHTKELCAKPLLHFSGSFVSEGEGHDLRDGQGVRLSHEEVEHAID
jgi:hypothetical protein